MSILQAIILAIVEGLTEFLPVSSTAHMKFTNPVIGVHENPFVDMFEVVVQLAAILAVVTIYWKKFLDFKNTAFYIKLIVALIPALIFGALLKKHIDAALSNLVFIAWVTLLGGVVLIFIDRLFKNNDINAEEQISYPKAFIIGCFQVGSILLPGLSRSAVTIVGGLTQKLTRKEAAEFSFFLAVPTLFAASVKSLWDYYKGLKEASTLTGAPVHLSSVFSHHDYMVLGIGLVVAYIVALIAIKSFIAFLTKYGFKWFGIYRVIIGSVILIALYFHISVHLL